MLACSGLKPCRRPCSVVSVERSFRVKNELGALCSRLDPYSISLQLSRLQRSLFHGSITVLFHRSVLRRRRCCCCYDATAAITSSLRFVLALYSNLFIQLCSTTAVDEISTDIGIPREQSFYVSFTCRPTQKCWTNFHKI